MSELYIPEEDADYLRCLQYVIDVEIENNQIAVFAERLQISVKTAINWKQKWIQSGLLAAVRRQMALGPLEDVRASRIRAARRFSGDIMERWLDIAANSRSDKTAFEAARALYIDIVKPLVDEEPSVGSEEAQFIKSHITRRIDPMAISREIKKGETPKSPPEETSDKLTPKLYQDADFGLSDNDEPADQSPDGDII